MAEPSTEPFDATDPYQIMCEHFRREVMNMYLEADRITIFRELSDDKKVNAFISGALVGMLVIPIAGTAGHVIPEQLLPPLVEGLPVCFAQAMSIFKEVS